MGLQMADGVAFIRMGNFEHVDEFYAVIRGGVVCGRHKSWAEAHRTFNRQEAA